MILSNELKQEFAIYARREAPIEACALIIETHAAHELYYCKNTSDTKDMFVIDGRSFVNAETFGNIVGVVHSHVEGPAEMSDYDIKSSERSGKPFYMLDLKTNTWCEYIPKKYRGALIGREWVHGVNDCYTLIQDFYEQKLNIKLADLYRAPFWWENTGNMYMTNFAEYGFRVVTEPRMYDIALCQIGSNVPNHGAILLEDNKILHHFFRHLSKIDIYDNLWRKATKVFLRHKLL